MTSFNHILFPVDFSQQCRAIRPFVESMALTFKSDLTLMHVIQPPHNMYGESNDAYPITWDFEAMKQDAEDMLERFLETPIDVRPEVTRGDVAIEVEAFAKANSVDLVMMPTHGYGPFRALLLGSVAAKLLHDLSCPVWTAAHTQENSLPKDARYRSILCAVDLSPCSSGLLERSLSLAARFGATLRIVHAVSGTAISDPRMDMNFSEFLFQSAREEIAKLQSQMQTNLETWVASGGVAQVVRQAAQLYEADLVIAGRGRLQQTLGRLRTNAYAIIRESPCPVLSF